MCECGTYCGSDCCAFVAAVAITNSSAYAIADAGAYVHANTGTDTIAYAYANTSANASAYAFANACSYCITVVVTDACSYGIANSCKLCERCKGQRREWCGLWGVIMPWLWRGRSVWYRKRLCE